MSKTRTFFDPGKILELAERGLTSLSILMERRVEKFLDRKHKKDEMKDKINVEEKARKQHNKELAKYQDFTLEMKSQDEREIWMNQQHKVAERIQELDKLSNDESRDAELDKD